MEQIKYQFNNNFNHSGDENIQKIQRTTDGSSSLQKANVTHFEDLANELIYEIFQFLDYFYAYEAFYNLNQRYYNLFTDSNLPIKINILPMSKSTFKRYNEDIIKPNMDRVGSLSFSDVFTYNCMFSSFYKLSDLKRVETLILHQHIEYEYQERFLDQLFSLPLLSSLNITFNGIVRNKDVIYSQIFRLPTLKYCKLLFENERKHSKFITLPICKNQYSSIEDFILNSDTVFVLFSFLSALSI